MNIGGTPTDIVRGQPRGARCLKYSSLLQI